MRKALASVVLVGAIVLGATACDGQNYNDPGYGNGQIAEYEYGYYNGPTWIEYSSPRLVYVSYSYYHSHGTLFANPRHIRVTPPRGVTIGKSRTTTTTVHSGSGSTRGTRSSIGGTTRTTRTTTTVGGSRSRR